jgi:hypothetical protein
METARRKPRLQSFQYVSLEQRSVLLRTINPPQRRTGKRAGRRLICVRGPNHRKGPGKSSLVLAEEPQPMPSREIRLSRPRIVRPLET